MTVRMRIRRELLESIRVDLSRPHAFARERVGFCRARLADGQGPDPYIILIEYASVADEDYIDDPKTPVRIGTSAITAASRICLGGSGVFHVHMHPGKIKPHPSSVDGAEIPRLIPPFRLLQPCMPHGFIILSAESAFCQVWMPKGNVPTSKVRITVVGRPLRIIEP